MAYAFAGLDTYERHDEWHTARLETLAERCARTGRCIAGGSASRESGEVGDKEVVRMTLVGESTRMLSRKLHALEAHFSGSVPRHGLFARLRAHAHDGHVR